MVLQLNSYEFRPSTCKNDDRLILAFATEILAAPVTRTRPEDEVD